jgi:hypothetical protein
MMKTVSAILLIATKGAFMGLGCSSAPVPSTGIEMIHSSPMADPYVFRCEGSWFVFGTQHYCLVGPKLELGKLGELGYDLEYLGRTPPADVWGFHPFRAKDGSFHAVATLHLGYFRTEIAAFDPAPGEKWTATTPITKWAFNRVLIPYEEGKMATYETKVCQDADGTDYIVYCRSLGLGNDVSIVAQRMATPSLLDPRNEPVTLLRPDGYESEYRNEGAPLQIVEGPNIVELNGYHILFYSVGDFANRNYKAGFAYCKTLVPPDGETYRKVLIEDPKHVWGGKTDREIEYLLQSQHPEWPNYVGDKVVGPGLLNLVRDGGDYYFVFHGYRPDEGRLDGGRRMLWKAKVKVNVSAGVPPAEWFKLEP